MNNELKELIKMSCLAGEPNTDAKNFIYEKATQHNISKQECDIYISGFLTNVNKDMSSKTHIYGYILYFSAFWDVFWGLSLTKYDQNLGFIVMFFGAVMYYFSFRLMEKNSLTTKILGLLVVGESTFILTMVVLKLLQTHSSSLIIFFTWSILTILILILFRRILLPEKIASKIDNLLIKNKN